VIVLEKSGEFIEELIEVMQKHGLSLSHEDDQGAFIIEDFKDENIHWLRDAYYRSNSNQKELPTQAINKER
jgi:hypothetical protein